MRIGKRSAECSPLTGTVEDYLETILRHELRVPAAPVPNQEIAAALDVTPGSVTTMLRGLSRQDLIDYVPYKGARLTDEGRRLAAGVLRRHRLLELFLVEVLGLSWSEVHEEADRLEHAASERLIERIADLLGDPQLDPHGDPIPRRSGEIARLSLSDLRHCALESPLRVVRITDQSASFLDAVEQWDVMPGTIVRVTRRDEVARALRIEKPVGQLQLGWGAAGKILVEEPQSSES